MQSISKSRKQKISIVLKYERKYLVFLSSSGKWCLPSTSLYDKGNVKTIVDFLNKMNIHNYNKLVYCTTTYNTKIYLCDIDSIPKNIFSKSKHFIEYKWLNEREILKLDNSNAILNSFFKKFKRNINNKKKMNSYGVFDEYEYDEKPTIELKKHDYESVRSIIEKRKDFEHYVDYEDYEECDYGTVKSVLDFLDEYDDFFNNQEECDCETVKSVLDFLEM
jgi:hypothetical protein